jgi:hypothetical protein
MTKTYRAIQNAPTSTGTLLAVARIRSRPAKSLRDRIQQADMLAGRYLGNANEASEAGQHDKAEKLYAKSQYWLDRYNLLTGNGEKPAPKQ